MTAKIQIPYSKMNFPFLLPIYKIRLDPHYVFHWMCHTMEIYIVESTYGRFLRFPNSIHLHYAFVSDPVKINTIFICYVFAVIQNCLAQQKTTETCQCKICDLYLQQKSPQTPERLRQIIQGHWANYLKYLNSIGRTYTDPLFLDQDFGLNDKKPDGIIQPAQLPTYFLSIS